MKFTNFKETRIVRTIESVSDYLEIELRKLLRDLQLGLNKLSLLDNFDSFSATVTIAAGGEVQIQNQLFNKEIPSQRLIVRSDEGGLDIVDGDTAWSREFVYLKNVGGLTGTVTVVFLK